MSEMADAHIHLFAGGYEGCFTGRPGVTIDEQLCYQSLAAEHGVGAALVVGYAAAPWCADNNAYLASLISENSWIYPTAFTGEPGALTVERLEKNRDAGFVGISVYLFDDASRSGLQEVPEEVWAWITSHNQLISVNARGEDWRLWLPVLEKHPELHILISHMGLPCAQETAPTDTDAGRAMAPILALAAFPGPCIKLSGFYALTTPGHAYPHTAALPYVECAARAFGVSRLLWGSDFSPCLDNLSYPQTFTHLREHFTGDDQEQVLGGNLLRLLSAARE